MWDVCNNNNNNGSIPNLSPNISHNNHRDKNHNENKFVNSRDENNNFNQQQQHNHHNGHNGHSNHNHNNGAPNNPKDNLNNSNNNRIINDDEDYRSSIEENRIKQCSPESHYKSQIFMQSVLDLHKSKSSLELRENSRNWSPSNKHPNQAPCDLFARFPSSLAESNLHHRLAGPPGASVRGPQDLHDRFHQHALNGSLMPGGLGAAGKMHGDFMRYEEKNVSSSTGTHQVKTFRAIRCYHCRMCDQEFVNKSDMQRHAKEIHRMDDKGYKCVKCLKSFPSSQQLAQHSLVHTNVRKYPCRYCDKAFKQLSHVQQHLRIHTGERPYQCAVDGCSKSFRQLSSLQQHIKGHNISLPKSYSIIHTGPSTDLANKDKLRTSLARPTNLVCQICEKHCNSEIRYFQHIHKYHPDFWRVFSSGRPLSDFIEVEEERYHQAGRLDKRLLCDEAGGASNGGMGAGLMGNGSDRGPSNEPLLLCCVCKKLFSREAYLLRHLETNKEDEAHMASLEELRKNSSSFFNAARYDSGTMVDEIKMETGNSVVGEMEAMTHQSSSSGGLIMESDQASVGPDEVFGKSSSSQNDSSNGEDKSRMNSPVNREAKSNDEFMRNGLSAGIGDLQNSSNLPSSSSSSKELNHYSPPSCAPLAPTPHIQSSPIQHNTLNMLKNGTNDPYYANSPAHTPVEHQATSSQPHQQRFDACRGDVLPFSAAPSPLYYSFSHHGQSPFFGGRRKSNEAEQLYRRRSEMINPFSSLDFSTGSRDFIGRDLVGRDTMTPFYFPGHLEDRRPTAGSMGGGGEEMFGMGGMGGMFDHSAAAAAGRLISGLR